MILYIFCFLILTPEPGFLKLPKVNRIGTSEVPRKSTIRLVRSCSGGKQASTSDRHPRKHCSTARRVSRSWTGSRAFLRWRPAATPRRVPDTQPASHDREERLTRASRKKSNGKAVFISFFFGFFGNHGPPRAERRRVAGRRVRSRGGEVVRPAGQYRQAQRAPRLRARVRQRGQARGPAPAVRGAEVRPRGKRATKTRCDMARISPRRRDESRRKRSAAVTLE